MFDEIIYLIKEEKQQGNMGQVQKKYKEKMLFSKKKPISQKEFFANKSKSPFTDIRMGFCFEINLLDYEDEQLIKYNNKIYKIYRIYEKGNLIELYCEVRGGINGDKN